MVLHNLSPASEDSLRNQHEHCTATLQHLKFWIIITAERLRAILVIWISVKTAYLWFYCNKACPSPRHQKEQIQSSTRYSALTPFLLHWARATGSVWDRLLISQLISKYCGREQLQPTAILRFCIVLEAQCDILLKNYFLTILGWKKSKFLYI